MTKEQLLKKIKLWTIKKDNEIGPLALRHHFGIHYDRVRDILNGVSLWVHVEEAYSLWDAIQQYDSHPGTIFFYRSGILYYQERLVEQFLKEYNGRSSNY